MALVMFKDVTPKLILSRPLMIHETHLQTVKKRDIMQI